MSKKKKQRPEIKPADLKRLIAELFVSGEKGRKSVERWAERSGISEEVIEMLITAFTKYLTDEFNEIKINTDASSDEEMEQAAMKVVVNSVACACTAFMFGWEAHRQYGVR